MAPPPTLVDALAALPSDAARGFRFIASDGQEHFFQYRALYAEAQRRAGLLAALGVGRGDRVALVIAEGHEFVLSFLACAVAGAVAVPVFPRATFKASKDYEDTVVHIVNAAGAVALLMGEGHRALLSGVPARCPGLRVVASFETAFAPGRSESGYVAPSIGPDDICFLQFTSGSTAQPKGVIVRHRNLVANTTAFLGPHGLDRRPDDIGVSWLPLFHDMGLIGFVLGPLIVDIPVVILPTASFARGPRVWLETVHRFRGTITYAPNFAYALAAKRLKARDLETLDLSCLRVAGCGAEPIHAETLRAFARAVAPAGFKDTAFLPSYGMAEATLAVTFHPLATPMEVSAVDPVALQQGRAASASGTEVQEMVSCGLPFPDHQLSIVDDQGQPLGEHQVGEVVVRGPSVADGYYENPEASREHFRDGALYTGDLGYLANGRLFICGRLKDLIIIRGANFHPQDLEWAVAELEGVRRGNVVAFSVPVAGEEKLVVVVECASTNASEVATAAAARVTEAFGLAPHEVVPVALGSLPKTSSGKLQRRRSRELYLSGQLARHVK